MIGLILVVELALVILAEEVFSGQLLGFVLGLITEGARLATCAREESHDRVSARGHGTEVADFEYWGTEAHLGYGQRGGCVE